MTTGTVAMQALEISEVGQAQTPSQYMLSLAAAIELRRAVEDMPDARERLNYVGQLTEDAAQKVITLVEQTQPVCDAVRAQGQDLAQALERMAQAPEMSVERARALMRLCSQYCLRSAEFAQAQKTVLSDILLSQSFQDLSGQVIKKVNEVSLLTEQHLTRLLIDNAPDEAFQPQATQDPSVLTGPQVPDKALKQDDVDDLLASLGF